MKTRIWLALVLGVVALGALIMYVVSGGTETLTILGEDSSNLRAYESLASPFTDGARVPAKFEATSFEVLQTKAEADFRSGSGRFDIVLNYNFSLAPYVERHYVAAARDVYSPSALSNQRIMEDVFPETLQETCYYYSDPHDANSEPAQFGFPFAANTLLLAYNMALFEDPTHKQRFRERHTRDLAPPKTWADYLEVATYFASQEGLHGVCLQGAEGGWLYYELCNYLFSIGKGTSLKKRGWERTSTLTIDTIENVRALEYYKQLHACSSGDYFTVDAGKQRDIMLQGRTAMAIMWSDYVQPLGWPSHDIPTRFGFQPIPGTISGIAGGAFYVNRRSRNMQAAASFVLFALRPDNQARLVEIGLCSPLRSAYTPRVLESVPYARALYASLDRGVFMFEASNDAELISSTLTTYVQKYIRGEITSAEAMRSAHHEVLQKRDH